MHDMKIPFGPQHPALPEPVHFTIKIEGETIRGVDIALGYNHRGVEKAFETRGFFKDIYLAERVCGLCGHAHSSTFVSGVEKILGTKVPERAQHIRTLVFELARIHSHYLCLGMCAHEMGFDTVFHLMFKDREHVLDILEMLTGNRVHYTVNTIGGVRRDFAPKRKDLKSMKEKLDYLKEKNKYYRKVFNTEHSILQRTRRRGVLRHKDVVELGVVGPNARASGVSFDIRKDEPYFSYDKLKFKMIRESRGDIFSRISVRFDEVFESLKIINQIINHIPAGKTKVPVNLKKIPKAETVSRAEAPRGELFYYIKTTKGKDSPQRVKIRTPTYATMNCVEKLLIGLQLADVPIAVMSIDPCLSCTDRMTVLDLDTGKKKIISGEELSHGHHH